MYFSYIHTLNATWDVMRAISYGKFGALDANYSSLGKLSTPLQSTSLLRGTQFI